MANDAVSFLTIFSIFLPLKIFDSRPNRNKYFSISFERSGIIATTNLVDKYRLLLIYRSCSVMVTAWGRDLKE